MLRLVLFALNFFASFSSLTGNLDPNGLPAQPTGDLTGNLDPDG